jgi:tetratricopeptide (TPR) repeat protein
VADPHPLPEQTPAATAEIPQPFRHPVAGYLLLPPEATARRSEQLEYIARQADRQIRRGFELAGRKAHFTARSQFIRALRLLAQGLDAEHRTDVHSRSLAVGLTAMKEAEDFIPTASGLEADLDVPAIVDRHRTPVLKDSDTEHLTPLLALTCYFTFAQEQLAAGAGNEVAGSMALHALGKLYGVLAQHNSGDVRAGEAKAVAFYQAALLTYPRNYMAANDLGVLLARCGNCRDAEAAMKYSLSLNRQPTGWHNLAVVYRQLGQAALARRAEQLSEAARRDEAAHRKALGNASHQRVRWMDPASFLQLRANTPAVPLPKFTGAKPAKAEEPNRSARGTRRSVLGWLPWRVHEERK